MPTARRPSLVELLVEARRRFELVARSSSRPALWRRLFRATTLPLLAWGRLRRFRATAGGQGVDLVCVGWERRFADLLASLFGRLEPDGRGGLRATWRERRLSSLAGDGVLVDLHAWFEPAFERRGWLIVPESVSWGAEVSRLLAPPLSRSLRTDQRRALLGGDLLERAGGAADWDELFDRMVLPYARRRFADWARLPSRYERRHLRRHGEILFVRRGGRRISGLVVVPTAEGAALDRLGVRDGDLELLRAGALSSLLLLGIDWIRAQGFRRLDAGPTSPFPGDGAARFKAKFGLVPSVAPASLRLALRCRAGGPLAEAFRRSPIFHLVGGRLAVFAGGAASR